VLILRKQRAMARADRAEAMARARQLTPLLAEFKSAGMSARQMAAELTARGIATTVLRAISLPNADSRGQKNCPGKIDPYRVQKKTSTSQTRPPGSAYASEELREDSIYQF
jgi:hypothetical protein